MRVAQVLLRYDAPGGVETHVRALTQELVRAGEEVVVYASDLYSEDGWVRRPDASRAVDGVRVERFPAVKRLLPGLTLPLLPGLVEALDRDRPEVIHAHSHRYGHVLEASLVSEARNLPLVISTHYHPADPWEPPRKKALLRVQDHGFGMTAYRNADALIVESEHEAALVREFAPARKVRIVPPGIHLEEWTPGPDATAAPTRLGLPQGYFFFLGRLAPNKGLLTFLEAWAGLPTELRLPWLVGGPDWGTGDKLKARAAELGVSRDLRLLGRVPEGPELRELFAGARAFVLPSDYEAFGLVLLDAMAASTAVVATAVGGVPEVVEAGRTGVLVPRGDVGALREALREVASDPARARAMGAAGRRRVEERYSWRRTADALRGIYREAAEGRRA